MVLDETVGRMEKLHNVHQRTGLAAGRGGQATGRVHAEHVQRTDAECAGSTWAGPAGREQVRCASVTVRKKAGNAHAGPGTGGSMH